MSDILVFIVGAVWVMVLSAVLGLDTHTWRHPDKLLAHVLIGLGAYAFAYTAFHIPRVSIMMDPIGTLSSLVLGTGVLAFGSAWHSRREGNFFAEGAQFWVSGAVGALSGVGFGVFAGVLAILAKGVALAIGMVFARLPKCVERTFYIHVGVNGTIDQIQKALALHPVLVSHKQFDLTYPDRFVITVRGTPLAMRLLLGQLRLIKGVDVVFVV